MSAYQGSRVAAAIGFCTAAILLLIGGATASAQTSGQIYACVSKNGQIQLVSPGTACKSNESPATWSIQGPKGDKGDTGPAGPKGDKGDPGQAGPKGDTGETGPRGADGATGPQGVQGVQGVKGDTGPAGNGLATGSIKGKLEQCGPGGPVPFPYSLISVAGHSFTAATDALGNFEFSYLPTGVYELIPPGFFIRVNPVAVTAGQVTQLAPILTNNLQTDTFNCGACGNSCGPTGTCVAGVCATPPAPTCVDGIMNGTETGIDCGGTCPNTCNTVTCLPGEVTCQASLSCRPGGGSCACPIGMPFQCGDGSCTTNPSSCSPSCPAATPYRCPDGACVAGPASCPVTCGPATPVLCPDNTCAQTAAGCLACSAATPFRCADGSCAAGPATCPVVCGPAVPFLCPDNSCALTAAACPAPGCTAGNPYKCADGTCRMNGTFCAPPECSSNADCGIGQSCLNKACVQTCPIGQGLCGGTCLSLNTVTNCGACGRSCATGFVCGAGICTPDPNLCAAGETNCGGTCRSTATDVNNCGACGLTCGAPNASASCVASTCQFTCNAGFGNCDGLIGTGCEASLSNDVNNCGGCNLKCDAGQSCTNGQCTSVEPAAALYTPARPPAARRD